MSDLQIRNLEQNIELSSDSKLETVDLTDKELSETLGGISYYSSYPFIQYGIAGRGTWGNAIRNWNVGWGSWYK